nr:hypothetical protein [Tanacetum cinerariifolium]
MPPIYDDDYDYEESTIPLNVIISQEPPSNNEEINTIPEKESDEFIKSNVKNLIPIQVLENIKRKDSYDSNLDEPDLLVTPLCYANEDECFDSRGDVDEINDFKDG